MAAEVRLSRELRFIDGTMSGVGAMIGAGIFELTGIAAGLWTTAHKTGWQGALAMRRAWEKLFEKREKP